MQTFWEAAKIIGIYWIVIFDIIWRYRQWKKDKWRISQLLPILHKTTLEEIEQKVYSFNEALFPKIILDEQGIIKSVNDATEKLFQFTEVEMRGNPVEELIIPARFRDSYKRFKISLVGKSLENKVFASRIVTKKDGTEIPVEVTIRKKQLDKDSFYVAIIRDISAEVAKDNAYKEQIATLQHLVKIMEKGEELQKTGSWQWNVDPRIDELTVSAGYRKILGLEDKKVFKATEIRGRVWKSDKQSVNEKLQKAREGEAYELDYKMIRGSDIKIIFLHSSVEPEMDIANQIVRCMYGSARLVDIKNIDEVK